MALGILESHKLDSVPGTCLLSAKVTDNQVIKGEEATELKRGTGKQSHIILVPQPSDDPRDPLNWPKWKKEACYWTLVFTSSFASAISPLASPAYVLLAKEFHVSVGEVSSSFGAHLLGTGIFALLQIPLAIKYGYRIVYLLSTFLMFISCIWAALSTNLMSIHASRVFQGLGGAPARSLVALMIENIYFVHERGSRTCIWSLFKIGGSVLIAMINGYVTQDLSWRPGFWFVGAACGVAFIAVFVFVPETTYRREEPAHCRPGTTRHENTSTSTNAKQSIESTVSRASATSGVKVHVGGHRDDVQPASSSLPAFLSQRKIYSGTFSDESVWKIFLRPFSFLLSPLTWFFLLSDLIPSVSLGIVSVCLSMIFTTTYGFNPGQIGLTHLSFLVGTLLAIVVTGPLGDWWIVWMSQRNRGIYEPEYRLTLMFSMLVGAFGYIGWALGNDNRMPWIGAVACLMIMYFSTVASSVAIHVYLLDTHGADSLYIISMAEFAMSVLIYASAFFANDIVRSAGIKRTLLALGACQAICWLASIPMYVYGKRVRAFIARHPRLFRRRDLSASQPSSSGSAAIAEIGSKC